MLLGKSNECFYEDVKNVNQNLYEQIQSLKTHEYGFEGQVAEIYFKYEGKNMLGEDVNCELVPDGNKLLVTDANKQEYIKLVTKKVIIDFCVQQYEMIKQGFN